MAGDSVPANAGRSIASWAGNLRFEDLPASAVDLVKRAFLDTIAVSLSGSRLDASRLLASLTFSQGAGRPEASAIGTGRKASITNAALLNGTAAHAELFDDNSEPMISHPSAPLVSALLPLGQARHASGAEVITAYAAGFEIGVGLGRRLNPQIYEAGWHVTRVLGVIGATAACARLLRLDLRQTEAALGIAASMASGIRQNFGTMTMALHVGLTARDAVHAALLAEAGFGADGESLDGRYGLFRLFGGKQPEEMTLGKPYELLESGIIFKPFPSGAPSHAAVDAALALRHAIHGRFDRIQRIKCLVHPWNFMTLRGGIPQDALRAKVSLHFCVAAALRYGELTSDQFTPACVSDPALQALMGKIGVEQDGELPDNGLFPAELQLVMEDGETLSERREVPPGAPGRPMTNRDLVAKFRSCARGLLDPGTTDRVGAYIGQLEQLDSIGQLCGTLEGPPAL